MFKLKIFNGVVEKDLLIFVTIVCFLCFISFFGLVSSMDLVEWRTFEGNSKRTSGKWGLDLVLH
jgi:hypothetical protein